MKCDFCLELMVDDETGIFVNCRHNSLMPHSVSLGNLTLPCSGGRGGHIKCGGKRLRELEDLERDMGPKARR